MTKKNQLGLVALIVGLALTLGACGPKGGESGPTNSTETAQVTFKSDPTAEIWVDGKASGKTPSVLSLPSGSHEVRLKRSGFEDVTDTITVEGGKAITVDGTLPVAGSDAAALRRLSAVLGEKHEPYAKPTTHRGAGDSVTLYYPMGDVRRAGLSTYRVEVDPSYDYEGYIEFRKGRKVLHREKFEPDAMITEKALPAEVLEAARNGASLTWGLAYDNKRRKRDQKLVKFKVISKSREKKLAKKMAKTTSRKEYKVASPLLQEMTEIEELKRYRLYSEVLVRSLAVLNGWEDTMLPYANMVDVMARLKLKESGLYKFAASQVSGAGGMRLVKGGQGAVTNKGRNKSKGAGQSGGLGSSASETGKVQSSLPQVAVAPPSKRSGKTGMKPGGLGVKPTDNGSRAAKSADGPAGATPGTATGGDTTNPLMVQRMQLDRQLEELKERLREADLRAANHAEAMENLDNIQKEIEGMGETVDDAEKAAQAATDAVAAAEKSLMDLESSGTATASQLEAAQEAAHAARQAEEQARSDAEHAKERVRELEQDLKRAEGDMRRITKEAGDSGGAAAEAERLREEISRVEDQIQQTNKQILKSGQAPNDPTADPGTDATGQPLDPNAARQSALSQAESNLNAAQSVLDAANTDRANALTEVEAAHGERDAAQQAYEAIANGTMPAAEKELDDKIAALDALVASNAPQSQIDDANDAVKAAAANVESVRSEYEQAEAARNAAEANASRADIELARLEADAVRAEQDKIAAEEEITKLSK